MYELKRGGGSMFIFHELTWLERLSYRLQCYSVRKIKKQYYLREGHSFKWIIDEYLDGTLVSSKELWANEVEEYIESLEKDGYTLGYTQEEVDKVKERYRTMRTEVIKKKG